MTIETIERISAITLKVTDMLRSVRFYNEILGLEVIYGGPHSSFSFLRTADAQDAILNLEQGTCSGGWGQLIFHVKDVDELWAHLRQRVSMPHGRGMQVGVNATSICTMPMATSCRLQSRCGEISREARRAKHDCDHRFPLLRCRRSAARRIAEGMVENAPAMSAMVRKVGLLVARSNSPM